MATAVKKTISLPADHACQSRLASHALAWFPALLGQSKTLSILVLVPVRNLASGHKHGVVSLQQHVDGSLEHRQSVRHCNDMRVEAHGYNARRMKRQIGRAHV